ncbi:MAG: NUDIX domain-containing protein, partial [Clostridia bacterium]|nr:NUDIX domain-containing protein [Clostridia bacterium]
MKMEIWELCDIDGKGVGVYLERGKDLPKGYYHPVVEIWTKMPDGRILLTQRHPEKPYALKWECSGGSMVAGEDFPLSASRELEEETGISVAPEKLIYLGKVVDLGCVLKSFLALPDTQPDIRIQKEEVVGYKLVTVSELEAMEDELTDWARDHFRMF